MAPRIKFVLGAVPCLVAFAGAAFAQDTTAAPATGTAATTTTTTAAPAGGAAPAMPATPADTTAATTTTTTTQTAAPADTTGAPLPKTGGDPSMFVLFGGALSGGALALRRRFSR